jgi:hypothetical protein
MAAVKDAVVRWASTAAASDRKIADDLEKLGRPRSDVSNLHERLVKSLRLDAKGFDEASTRLQAGAGETGQGKVGLSAYFAAGSAQPGKLAMGIPRMGTFRRSRLTFSGSPP